MTQDRRSFMKQAAALGLAVPAALKAGVSRAAGNRAAVAGWPEMTYRTLGRTGFKGSRLVFGCGAALSKGQATALLEPAFEAGVNVFDVGTRQYYGDAEKNLAPFLRRHDDDVFLISKGMLYIELEPDERISASKAKEAARNWTRLLDDSLGDLGVDHVDAYYMMAANNVSAVDSDEIYGAFVRAREAGKVSHFGLSTHENAAAVLAAATRNARYDLAQVAITPAGWYDWGLKGILADSPPMTTLRPLLDEARESGIGLIGMKAGRHLAGKWWLGGSNSDAYDKLYSAEAMDSPLTPFQRSYAYVLAHGMDAVNADMQIMDHLRENFVAATTGTRYFV